MGVIRFTSLLFVLFFAVPLLPTESWAAMVSILKENVNMRSGPGTKYRVQWKLSKGYPLIVLRQKGNWLRVKDFENDKGWVYKPLTVKKAHLIVKKKLVNIRSGPGTRYGVVSEAKYGVVFRTLKKQGGFKGWAKVKHEKTGIVGWIRRDLLWGW